MSETKRFLHEEGLAETYWGKIIITAEEEGGFTPTNRNESMSWVTCACGKITQDIPRVFDHDTNTSDYPVDKKLQQLGNWFCSKVYNDEYLVAAKTLIEIEERAMIVARENVGPK
jgi:hypothetical protein